MKTAVIYWSGTGNTEQMAGRRGIRTVLRSNRGRTERQEYRTVWLVRLGRRRVDAQLGGQSQGRRRCSGWR